MGETEEGKEWFQTQHLEAPASTGESGGLHFLHHWSKAQASAFYFMTEKSRNLSQANKNPYILGDSPASL